MQYPGACLSKCSLTVSVGGQPSTATSQYSVVSRPECAILLHTLLCCKGCQAYRHDLASWAAQVMQQVWFTSACCSSLGVAFLVLSANACFCRDSDCSWLLSILAGPTCAASWGILSAFAFASWSCFYTSSMHVSNTGVLHV